jgi:hypothetical protein
MRKIPHKSPPPHDIGAKDRAFSGLYVIFQAVFRICGPEPRGMGLIVPSGALYRLEV